MTFSPEDIKTVISVGALVVALVSLYFTKVNWLQSNRPIVTAYVTEHSSWNMAATFNLVLANTGNRPAVRVRLRAPETTIRSLLEEGSPEKNFELIASNFKKEAEVPLLRNGEVLTTSFGAFTSKASGEQPWLKYGAEIEIAVDYQDLEGRVFESRQPLKVYAREGFGGGSWSSTKA